MIYRFGDYELDTNRHELRAKGEPQALEPQVFRLLMVLIENSNRVVTRDELMDTIWQGRLVSDSALVSRIRSARQAIGDSGEHQTFIQTVRGCGYRFVGSPIAESEVSFQTATSRKPSAVAESRLLPVLTTRVLAQFDRIWSSLAIGTERLGWLVILLLLIGIGMGMGVWRFLPSSAPPRAVADPSIAVLPFADLSEAGDQEFFAAGVAEEILNTLIKVKDLRVVGRNSSFPFKAKNVDVKTIGEQLNVAAVLAGSVRRSQDRVRITVQLVDTASGYHLWSETYDRKMQDIFAMQDEIAQAVAHRLHIELGDEDPERPLVSQETDDLEAYRLYLQGRYLWKRRDGNNIPQAIKFFEETIARDTDFARAHSALAAAYTVLPTYTKANRSESFEAAERAAHTALRLNPELSEPHAVLGRLYSKRSQWRRAERQFRHAVALDPEDPVTRFWYGIHSISVGRLQEALTHYEKALSIDPAWGLAVCLHSGH